MASLLTAYPLFETNGGYLLDSLAPNDFDNEQSQSRPFNIGDGGGVVYLVKKSLPPSSSSLFNEQDERKLAAVAADESDEYLEKLAKVFIEYGRLLKNPQLQMSQKQFLFYRFNNLMLKLKKYFSEYPENEIVFEKILKKLNAADAAAESDNDDSTETKNNLERMPFKWG